MGYQLNKPDLRREMEADCTRVANGQKTKEEILGPVLAKMLDCFKHANIEVHKLDEAVARRFDKLGTNRNNEYALLQANFSICGQCNGMMALKQMQSRNQRQQNTNASKILHCNMCSEAYLMPRYHQQVSPAMNSSNSTEPQICPLCQFQVIKITLEGGSSYHMCPKCFRDAPEEHGGDASTEFPCTKCTNTACLLASGVRGADIEVFPCPFCSSSGRSGKVSLKKNSNGPGYRLTCSNGGRDGCQYCIWLPKEASEISVKGVESEDNITPNNGARSSNYACSRCSDQNKLVRKLKFVWNPGSVPPMYDRETTTCILCDSYLKSDFRINIPDINRINPRRTNNTRGVRSGRGSSSNSNNNYSTGSSRGGRGRNTSNYSRNNPEGRGSNSAGSKNACYRCGQPGHFANACPNQR